jgi:hypothetical protein
MNQERIRPIRHSRTQLRPEGDQEEELWPLSAREFLKTPAILAVRKPFLPTSQTPNDK